MFKPKRIYEYLGDDSATLNARARARCPSCSPPVVPTIPETVGEPLLISNKHTNVSCDAIDDHRFVVATTMPGSGHPYLYGCYVGIFEAGIDGAPTPILLDEVVIDPSDTFIAIDVVVLTSTKFIVYLQDTTPSPDALRAYVFTIDGSNQLTYAAKQTVGNVDVFNVELSAARISDTKSVLCYTYSVAGPGLGYTSGRVVTLDPATDIITMGAEGMTADLIGGSYFDMVYSGSGTIFYLFCHYKGADISTKPKLLTFDVASGVPVFGTASSAGVQYTGATTRAMALVPGTTKVVCAQNTIGYNASFEVIPVGGTPAAVNYTTETRFSGCDIDTIVTRAPSGDIKMRILSAYTDASPALPSTLILTHFTWTGSDFTQDGPATIVEQYAGGDYADIKLSTTGMSATRYAGVYTRTDNTMRVFVLDTGD